MHVKIQNGTAFNGGRSLCTTCRNSSIIRGGGLDEEVIICHANPIGGNNGVTFKVVSCTDYRDEREPPLAEMVAVAWVLRPHSRRRPAGFVRSTELAEDEFDAMVSDLYRKT